MFAVASLAILVVMGMVLARAVRAWVDDRVIVRGQRTVVF